MYGVRYFADMWQWQYFNYKGYQDTRYACSPIYQTIIKSKVWSTKDKTETDLKQLLNQGGVL